MSAVEECYRGSQVRVFRLNRPALLAGLKERAAALMRARPEVIEVRLFGSLATDRAGPGSDADLLIVLRDSAIPFIHRIPDYARFMTGAGVGCDVFPYTKAELARLREEHDPFTGAAWEQSVVLASRREAGDEQR